MNENLDFKAHVIKYIIVLIISSHRHFHRHQRSRQCEKSVQLLQTCAILPLAAGDESGEAPCPRVPLLATESWLHDRANGRRTVFSFCFEGVKSEIRCMNICVAGSNSDVRSWKNDLMMITKMRMKMTMRMMRTMAMMTMMTTMTTTMTMMLIMTMTCL